MEDIHIPPRICFVCDEPITDQDGHWVHEPDCPNRLEPGVWTCQCDLHAHPWCCPVCNPELDTIAKESAIRGEVIEKMNNSFSMFSFWDIIDCCELTDEEKRWAKIHLMWNIRLCTQAEIENNESELSEEEKSREV